MSIKDELKNIETSLHSITANTMDEEVTDEQAAEITERINAIIQTLMELTAAHDIEIGDERVD